MTTQVQATPLSGDHKAEGVGFEPGSSPVRYGMFPAARLSRTYVGTLTTSGRVSPPSQLGQPCFRMRTVPSAVATDGKRHTERRWLACRLIPRRLAISA